MTYRQAGRLPRIDYPDGLLDVLQRCRLRGTIDRIALTDVLAPGRDASSADVTNAGWLARLGGRGVTGTLAAEGVVTLDAVAKSAWFGTLGDELVTSVVAELPRAQHLYTPGVRRSDGVYYSAFIDGLPLSWHDGRPQMGITTADQLADQLARSYETIDGVDPELAAAGAHLDLEVAGGIDFLVGNGDRHGTNARFQARTGRMLLYDGNKAGQTSQVPSMYAIVQPVAATTTDRTIVEFSPQARSIFTDARTAISRGFDALDEAPRASLADGSEWIGDKQMRRLEVRQAAQERARHMVETGTYSFAPRFSSR